MPETTRKTIVTNTSPLIAIVAATGDLTLLKNLQLQIIVPYEVAQEINSGGRDRLGTQAFNQASWLEIQSEPIKIAPYLLNTLDRGEASVIQTALNRQIETVCIDEKAGRRVARLSQLKLTGSIGLLLKAKQNGQLDSMATAIQRMQQSGIRLSQGVIHFAMVRSGEIQ
jgi:predicted nucleic acid-binding protein